MDTWNLPVVPTSGEGAPTQIVDACGLVGADLRWRRYGPDIYLDNCRWTISLLEDGYCHVQLASGPRPRTKTSGTELVRALSAGAPHMDQSLAEVTVLIADAVQGELAGYSPHIQGPIEDKRLLLPQIRSDRAIWRDLQSDTCSICTVGPFFSADPAVSLSPMPTAVRPTEYRRSLRQF